MKKRGVQSSEVKKKKEEENRGKRKSYEKIKKGIDLFL